MNRIQIDILMSNKHLVLVDFDGVILKNKYAGAYINKKVCSYIEKKTHIRNPQIIQEFNRKMYTSYGHTLIGLKNHGYDVSLQDFNEFTYNDTTQYKHLSLSHNEKCEWKDFLIKMETNNYTVRLLSNAPIQWLTHFIEYDQDLFDIQDHIDTFKSDLCYDLLLKPQRDVYFEVMSRYPKHTYHFIDDNISNFRSINNDKRWNKLWFTDEKWMDNKTQIKVGQRFYAVKDFACAADVIMM